MFLVLPCPVQMYHVHGEYLSLFENHKLEVIDSHVRVEILHGGGIFI